MNQPQARTGTYVGRILELLAAHPDRDALVDETRRFSYRQARSLVHGMAAAMRARGIGAGDTVAIVAGNRAEAVLLQLAIHLLGARLSFVPAEPALPELVAFLTRAKMTAFVYDPAIERAAELARRSRPPVTLTLGPADQGEDLLALAGEAGQITDPAPPEDVATLFYTGGTTGRPKLVLHQHDYYGALVPASARRKAECPVPQRFLICTAVNHSSGHITTVLALLAEGTAVLVERFDPAKVIATMSREKITSLVVVPPMLYEILDHPFLPEQGFPDLVRIHYGAAPTPSARIRMAIDRFGPVLRQTYGLTEVPVVTVLEPHEHDLSVPGRLTAVGRPLPGLAERGGAISLRNEAGEVSPGEVGEVCVRGPTVMREYWDDPELTAQAFTDGWFRTGDLGRWDDDGYLHLVDRVRDVIVTGLTSDNVYSNLLEDVLAHQPGIKVAAVVGLPDAAYGERVHAVCVADDPSAIDVDELRRVAVAELGVLYEPRTVTFIDSLPLTALGKIDKKALRRTLAQLGESPER